MYVGNQYSTSNDSLLTDVVDSVTGRPKKLEHNQTAQLRMKLSLLSDDLREHLHYMKKCIDKMSETLELLQLNEKQNSGYINKKV